MRIAFLSPTAEMGGAEVCLLDLLAGLRHTVPDWPLLLMSANEGPLVERAAAIGVATAVVPLPERLAALGDFGTGPVVLAARTLRAIAGLPAYARELSRTLRAFQPGLVHTNGCKMHLLGSWVRPAGTPLLWHIHDYIGDRRVMRPLLRRLSSRATVAVCNSASVAADFRRVCRGRLSTCHVHNGIDLDQFDPLGPALDLDAAAGLPPAGPGTVRLGLVGTMARWKGHRQFLEAFARVAGLNARAYIVGGPLYRTAGSQSSIAELKDLAVGLGLNGRVGFTGFLRARAQAFRALDVIVHASVKPEPFGLVIAEAMACGRPVIVSHAGGAAELATPEVDCLAHEPGSVNQLASAMSRLIEDPALRARLGGAARASALRRFDRRRMAAEMIDIYRQVGGPAQAVEPVPVLEGASR